MDAPKGACEARGNSTADCPLRLGVRPSVRPSDRFEGLRCENAPPFLVGIRANSRLGAITANAKQPTANEGGNRWILGSAQRAASQSVARIKNGSF